MEQLSLPLKEHFPRDATGWTLLVAGNSRTGWFENDAEVLIVNPTAREDSAIMDSYVRTNGYDEIYASVIASDDPLHGFAPRKILRFIARREAKLGYVPPACYDLYMNFAMQRVQRMLRDGAKGLPDGPLVAGLWYRSPQLSGGRDGLVSRIKDLAQTGRGLAQYPSPVRERISFKDELEMKGFC